MEVGDPLGIEQEQLMSFFATSSGVTNFGIQFCLWIKSDER